MGHPYPHTQQLIKVDNDTLTYYIGVAFSRVNGFLSSRPEWWLNDVSQR